MFPSFAHKPKRCSVSNCSGIHLKVGEENNFVHLPCACIWIIN